MIAMIDNREDIMIDMVRMNNTDLDKYISWLEYEISLCLEYDLPMEHLEKELAELTAYRCEAHA